MWDWALCFSSVLDWTSPARAGWTGPVPFKFFTGSAGTLERRREETGLPRPDHVDGTLLCLLSLGSRA